MPLFFDATGTQDNRREKNGSLHRPPSGGRSWSGWWLLQTSGSTEHRSRFGNAVRQDLGQDESQHSSWRRFRLGGTYKADGVGVRVLSRDGGGGNSTRPHPCVVQKDGSGRLHPAMCTLLRDDRKGHVIRDCFVLNPVMERLARGWLQNARKDIISAPKEPETVLLRWACVRESPGLIAVGTPTSLAALQTAMKELDSEVMFFGIVVLHIFAGDGRSVARGCDTLFRQMKLVGLACIESTPKIRIPGGRDRRSTQGGAHREGRPRSDLPHRRRFWVMFAQEVVEVEVHTLYCVGATALYAGTDPTMLKKSATYQSRTSWTVKTETPIVSSRWCAPAAKGSAFHFSAHSRHQVHGARNSTITPRRQSRLFCENSPSL